MHLPDAPLSLGLLPPVGETRRIDGAERHYATPNGTFPSVTTILDATMPRSKREVLEKWRTRVGPAEAERIRRAAARRGSSFHDLVHEYLMAWPRPAPPADLYFKAALPFIHRIQRVLLIEAPVWHDKIKYAGSLDLLAVIDGKVTICDWKTSDKPKDRRYLAGHMPQLAAYAAAVYRLYGVLTEEAMVIPVTPRTPVEPLSWGPGQIFKAWTEFKARAWQYHHEAWFCG